MTGLVTGQRATLHHWVPGIFGSHVSLRTALVQPDVGRQRVDVVYELGGVATLGRTDLKVHERRFLPGGDMVHREYPYVLSEDIR